MLEEEAVIPMNVIELCIRVYGTGIIPDIVRVQIAEKVRIVVVIIRGNQGLHPDRLITCDPQVRVQLDLRGQDLVQPVNKS